MATSRIDDEIRPYKASFDVPLSRLSTSTLLWLSTQLNVLKPTLSPNTKKIQDWRGLAELFGCDVVAIGNIEMQANPCYEMLTRFAPKKPDSIFGLLEALRIIERYDIIADDEFFKKIDEDSMATKCIQDNQIGCSEDNHLDATNIACPLTDTDEKFTAFICYHPDDISFVRILIDNLEKKQNLKLFIPARDLPAGGCGMYDLARLIKTRCEKLILVLSPKFILCPDCNFQLSYAMALDIVKKERKIIPVIYEKCEIPDIIIYLAKLDYTRTDVKDWFWPRLINSIKTRQQFEKRDTASIDSGLSVSDGNRVESKISDIKSSQTNSFYSKFFK